MKIVILLALVAYVTADDDFFTMEKRYKKWADYKVMEACYGEENMETFHVKTKQAMKKCFGMESPALKMYEMMKPARLVQGLMRGMKEMKGKHMMKMMMKMKNMGMESPTSMAYVPFVPQQQKQSSMGDEMHMMMKMMKMMMMKKMMKKMMMSMHDGPMDMMESAGSARDMDDDDEGVDISAILRLVGANANGARRTRRDAALFELEDKLEEKLTMEVQKFEAKLGNVSCLLQEWGWVDKDMNLYLDGMINGMDEYKWEDDWFKNRCSDSMKHCYAAAESIPKNVAKLDIDEKWGRIRIFYKCHKESQQWDCLDYDVKKMLEKHFKPLEELVKETGFDEKTLLYMTKSIVDDSFSM